MAGRTGCGYTGTGFDWTKPWNKEDHFKTVQFFQFGNILTLHRGRHQVHIDFYFWGEGVWGMDIYAYFLFLWINMVCVLIYDMLMLWNCKDWNFKFQFPEVSPSLWSLFRPKGWKSILTRCHPEYTCTEPQNRPKSRHFDRIIKKTPFSYW